MATRATRKQESGERWHRYTAGHYHNGRFEIVKDPTGGDFDSGCGFNSWHIYEVGEDEKFVPDQFRTLRDAKRFLAARPR